MQYIDVKSQDDLPVNEEIILVFRVKDEYVHHIGECILIGSALNQRLLIAGNRIASDLGELIAYSRFGYYLGE